MPFRNVQHKCHITKVMFVFWSSTEEVAARRSSKLKSVNVNRIQYRTMLVVNLFPAIKAKWPTRRTPIYVEQDGAPAYVKEADIEVVYNGNRYVWDINLYA